MASALPGKRRGFRGIVRLLFDAGSPQVRPEDLAQDCAEERDLASSLEGHAMAITYPSLKEPMERIARETAEHARALARFLESYRIDPPEAVHGSHPTAFPSMVAKVQEDALAVKRRAARYEDLVRRAPRPLQHVLGPIYEDKREHVRVLVDVALRICR